MASPFRAGPERVPVRTILTAIGLVLLTVVAVGLVQRVERILVWLVIAAFFAVALAPAVNWVQRRWFGGRRRALATLVVVLPALVVVVGLRPVFVVPLAREGTKFAGQLPDLVDQAKHGHGAIGRFLVK